MLEDEDECDQHLCIVVTPPFNSQVVVVSVTTRRGRSETLVILQPGEHPFIQVESVISYYYARIVNIEDVEKAVKSKDAFPREAATESLLNRAQCGLIESEFTPYEVLSFYKDAIKV